MATDSPRILELRRRVQADPASIAFAQLAEEYRRAGAYEEAVGICRAGLARHPGYLSARITLSRALIELGGLDEAKRELEIVVESAPDNLAAIRGLAEIFQRQGSMGDALEHYKRALALAKHDPDLENTVDRISQAIAPPPPVTAAPAAQSVEELFDFDKLLAELGEPASQQTPVAPPTEMSVAPAPEAVEVRDVLRPTNGLDLKPDDTDAFAELERDLRARQEQRDNDEQFERDRRVLEDAWTAEEAHRREAEEQRLRDDEAIRIREKEAEERRLREAEELRLREAEEERRRDEEAALALRAVEEQRARDEAIAHERQLLEEQRRRDEEAARLLRELEDERARAQHAAREAEAARRLVVERRHRFVVNELESWLHAIVTDRDHHSSR